MSNKTVFICFILNLFLVLCMAVGAKKFSDPSVPDESDMDVIDQWISSEKQKGNDSNDSQNSNRGSLEPSSVVHSSNVTNNEDHVRKNENGEPCRCVKYYLCEVKHEDTTTTVSSTSTTSTTTESPTSTDAADEASQNILGVVDIRNELGGKNFTCPDDELNVCCTLKNIKNELPSTTSTTPSSSTTGVFQSTTKSPEPYTGHRHCGHRNEHGVGSKPNSGNDQEAQFGEFPWTAAIIHTEQNEDNYTVLKYLGGGSLLHPQVVLTVAHNVLGKSRTNLKVRLGEWDTQTNDEPYPSQDRGVKKVIIHDLFLKKTMYNDVALLILDEEVRFAPNVDTICLPPVPKKGKKPINFDGQLCYSAGWGKDQFGAEGRYSDIMKKVTVPIVPHDKCQQELQKSDKLPGFRLDKSFMCAGGSESGDDTCKGDGGSALVCSVRGGENADEDGEVHYVQKGATSWGLGCKSTVYPGVYADIQYLTPWILKTMEKEEMSTEYCTFK